MTANTSAPVVARRGSAWFLLTAFAAWLGVVTCFLFTVVVAPDPQPTQTLYGYNGISLGQRLLETASYFTVLSVTVVGIVHTVLWRQPERRTTILAVLRLDALVMIIVTGLVYAVVLAPTSTATGLNYANTVLMHYIVPPLAVLAWLFAGPRDLLRFRHVPAMLILPLAWLVYVLILGQAIGSYPYPFLDVSAHGWATVLVTVLIILIAATILAVILLAIDRLVSRMVSRRASG